LIVGELLARLEGKAFLQGFRVTNYFGAKSSILPNRFCGAEMVFFPQQRDDQIEMSRSAGLRLSMGILRNSFRGAADLRRHNVTVRFPKARNPGGLM